ncbi:d3fdb30f-830e-4e8c-b5cc-7eeafad8bb17-CDS [Sclerotinia trifoliorum]|uniref:D3fdb30f-830e-4e8c-b5cc-7eeafad8bb17-CDS n=1 Tax=Sclerotinia trifoliorum TaxID=28548 RepID=A0A8H2ZT33_9HELO|nr:d3fdb30f-830e-4e8c-b5cc-7eeafad8bb17-CDS [Sclerotinia trifoliorum]
MKITHTTYNEVRGRISTPPHPTPPDKFSNDTKFLTTAPASGIKPNPPQRSSSPISTKTSTLRSTTRRIKRYLKLHVRFGTRPTSQHFSRSGHGTSVRYPPGEMHPPTVPTQVGKYHSGSVRGSFSSRGEMEDSFAVVGSQAHEKGLEQRYKHVKGKKRPSYLKPREEAGGRISGEQGAGGLDFEAYMKQQQGLERDFGKGYNGGNNSPSPPNSPLKGSIPPRDISPPKFVASEDAGDSQKMRERQALAHGMMQLDFDNFLIQHRGLERDFGKGYENAGNSPSPPHASLRADSSRTTSPRTSPNYSSTPISVPVGHANEMGIGPGNMSQGDGVRFSDVQWSSVRSGVSATGTTGTTDSGIHAENSRERSAGMGMGKHKAAPGQRRLRRKAKFEERDQSHATTPASSRSQTVGKDKIASAHERREKDVQRESKEEVTTIEQLEMMRRAMWNGKLEKVVPPSREVPKHIDILHPSTPTSTSSGKSRNSKGKGKGKMLEGRASPIQILKGYMGHGVEVVHDSFEKKTNSKTKLPSPFEYLLYSSYEGKKGDRSSAGSKKKSKPKDRGREEEDSDEEFWGCIGDQNQESGILTAPHPGEKAEENILARGVGSENARKESNGDEVWSKNLENSCKLCRKRRASGPRGLCHTCERNLLNNTAWEEPIPHSRDMGDIRPTPPLKDQHIAYMRDMLATTPPPYNDPNYRPPLPAKDYQAPAKDLIQVSKVENSRPQIVNPSPVRQESQRLVYGGMGDSPRDIEIGFPEWQTHSLEIEGAKTEQMFKRWSENYRVEAEGAGKGNDFREEDGEEHVTPRDSIFYDFWGDILKGDGGPETPTLEESGTRG